jgi:hypothetical protein
MNKGMLITTMCFVSLLTSIGYAFVSKTEHFIEAQDNILMIALLSFFFMIVFGVGLGTLYIAYLHKDKPKKPKMPPPPPKSQDFILGGK